jgi:hypothetical protein
MKPDGATEAVALREQEDCRIHVFGRFTDALPDHFSGRFCMAGGCQETLTRDETHEVILPEETIRMLGPIRAL